MPPRHLKCALSLFLCAAAHAQFSQLGVSDDGSQAYFATSLRLPSEVQNQPYTAAIYRIANGVIERLTVPGVYPLPGHFNSDGNPQVSADGRVFAYTEYSSCYGGSSCTTNQPSSTSFLTIDGKPYGQTLQGEAQISRNSRFELNALRVNFFFSRLSDRRTPRPSGRHHRAAARNACLPPPGAHLRRPRPHARPPNPRTRCLEPAIDRRYYAR